LRCVIDHIVVSATKERIDATIFWKTGAQTPILLWRGTGRHVLIRELHGRGFTVFEIKEHLAAIGLGLLPVYWLFWKKPQGTEGVAARRSLTWLLAFFVWWNFIVGHVLNDIRGMVS